MRCRRRGRPTPIHRLVLPTVAATALLLSACGDGGTRDPDDAVEQQDPDAEPAPEPEEDDEPSTDTGDAPSDDGAAPEDADDTDDREEGDAADDPLERLAGTPTTERSEREGAWGDDLRIVDVRVGTHDRFDRVTFELAGDGEAGWWIEPQEEPVAQGSGAPLDVAGSTALVVAIQPLPYPEGGELTTPDRVAAPEGAVTLTEVVQDSLFEGLHRFALGLDVPAGYVVERLEDPERVVIDIVAEDRNSR